MADESLFQMTVVTPERILLDGTATEVILRTGEGDTTFLSGHAPLVGTIEPGVLRVVRGDGDEVRVAAHGGFVQVEQHVAAGDGPSAEPVPGPGTRVTMLLGVAELVEEIDTERARAALEAAEARVAELGGGSSRTDDEQPDLQLVEAEAALGRAQLRLETVEATSGTTPGT